MVDIINPQDILNTADKIDLNDQHIMLNRALHILI